LEGEDFLKSEKEKIKKTGEIVAVKIIEKKNKIQKN